MSAAHEASNKATVRRLLDAMSTGDAELLSQTIDEFFDPDALTRSRPHSRAASAVAPRGRTSPRQPVSEQAEVR